MGIVNLILVVGAIQGVFLSLLIFVNKNIFSRRLLALILFSVSIALFIAYFQSAYDYRAHTYLIKINFLLPLIFVPGLFVYLRKVTSLKEVKWRSNLPVFIPFFLLLAYNLPFYFGNVDTKLEYFLRSELEGNPLFSEKIEDLVLQALITFFGLLAVVESRKYSTRIRHYYSDLSKTKSAWIVFLSYSMFALSLIALVLSVGHLLTDSIPFGLNFITALGSTIMVFIIGYFMVLHPEALSEVSLSLKSMNDKPTQKEKQSSESHLHELVQSRILEALEKQRVYQNPDLTITDLASTIGFPSYLVSKVINQKMDNNFYSLINGQRLEEVKTKLKNKGSQKIIEVAYQAGFNSKTAFYESFKKDTGLTPREYSNQG